MKDIGNTVGVQGTVNIGKPVEIGNTVDVRGSVDVDNTLDINLAAVVGSRLVTSERGMFIGVSSTDNKIIPINWGSIDASR